MVEKLSLFSSNGIFASLKLAENSFVSIFDKKSIICFELNAIWYSLSIVED